MIRFAARPLRAVAVAALIGGPTILVPQVAYAADAGLRIVTRTTYTAVPAEKRVHVSVDATATNLTPDPPSGRYYYTDARFAVQPGIRNLTASAGDSTLIARIVSSSQEFTTIDVAFARGLFHDESLTFRFSFDIVDPGGAPQRDVRVANTLVAFPVWAFGSSGTPGSTVSVVIPAGYTVSVVAGAMSTSRHPDGTTVLTAGSIPDPTAFFAYVTAERPGAFTSTNVRVALPEHPVTVQVRAWDDDPQWGTRVGQLEAKGLPVLENLIGLPYKVNGELVVEEAAGLRLGDYAGVYNTATEEINARFDADGYTILHETAHTWFNEKLLQGRWIGEAWAEYYAVQAGRQIGADGQVFSLTPQLRQARIQLNDWGAIGTEPPETEDYAYAATYELANLIASRATLAGLRQVWRAADDAEASYQPPGATTPETGSAITVEGWQRLLDLLEERTHRNYDDLWRDWVVTPEEATQLQVRAGARDEYARMLTLAGTWQLPFQVRYELGAWQFDDVEGLMAEARGVLASRDQIAGEAAAAQLKVPDTLRRAFEAAATFDASRRIASDELASLAAIHSATAATDKSPTPLEWVGLLFADPQVELTAARRAFEQGDATESTHDAKASQAERDAATDTGRLRVSVTGGVLLLLDGAAMGLLYRRRRSRARRPASLEPLPGSTPTGGEAPLA